MPLDAIDRQLLGLLQRDGRASFASLGALVGLSAPAVKRRVDRLRAQGAIRAFTITVAPEALGWQTEAYIELFCRSRTRDEDIVSIIERHPEVVSATKITGEAYAMLHVIVRDVQDLGHLVELISLEPCVERTCSAVVLCHFLERADEPQARGHAATAPPGTEPPSSARMKASGARREPDHLPQLVRHP